MTDESKAIAAARQLEVDGLEFFEQKAESAPGRMLKELFLSLAADEKRHIRWLDDLAPGVADAATANRDLLSKLKDVFSAESTKDSVDAGSDVEVLDMAISLEQKVADIYTDWATTHADEKVKALGKVLAGQELFHKQLLENTKEFLEKPGDWFLQEERWNFEGG